MKGVSNKPICTYCHHPIEKKPIPVGDVPLYAHENCVKRDKVRLSYLFGNMGRKGVPSK